MLLLQGITYFPTIIIENCCDYIRVFLFSSSGLSHHKRIHMWMEKSLFFKAVKPQGVWSSRHNLTQTTWNMLYTHRRILICSRHVCNRLFSFLSQTQRRYVSRTNIPLHSNSSTVATRETQLHIQSSARSVEISSSNLSKPKISV